MNNSRITKAHRWAFRLGAPLFCGSCQATIPDDSTAMSPPSSNAEDTASGTGETGHETGTDTGPSTSTACQDRWEAIEEILNALESEVAEAHAPGAAIAIICDGALVLAEGVGLVHADLSDPVTSSTRFQIASATKMFTAAAALTMAEEGLLPLETEVEQVLPHINGSAPFKQPATLHHLLSHSAGYPTWFSDGDWSSYVLAEFFANNAEYDLWSPPGALYNYSNLGFSLAGLMLEEVDGRTFAELVEARVFAPAGMSTASMHADQVAAEGDFAYGHSGAVISPNVFDPQDSYYDTGYYGPMGGAWASVEDLARWGLVHMSSGGDVMGPEWIEALQTPQVETGQYPGQSYGYGLFIDTLQGPTVLSHSGSVGGYLTDWVLVPEAGFGVFITTNCDWYWPGSITDLALEKLVDLEEVDLTPYLTSADQWSDYAGTYTDPTYYGTIEVTAGDKALEIEFTDLEFSDEMYGYYLDYYVFYDETLSRYMPAVFWREEGEEQTTWLASSYGVATRIETKE
jgi:CubicO group peptidase (beta-lactamase class C family)